MSRKIFAVELRGARPCAVRLVDGHRCIAPAMIRLKSYKTVYRRWPTTCAMNVCARCFASTRCWSGAIRSPPPPSTP
ncbi:MAG: hypothetical protein R3F43_29325 [bacterium]